MVPAQKLAALRMDDVGAASKRYEVYSNRSWRAGPLRISGNWLFLKYLPGVKSWGPYRELTAVEWHEVFDILRAAHARMTVAVTAAWADRDDRVTPFPARFPAEAAALKEGVAEGLIEIANHGLTHCVLEGNLFRPRWMTGNRTYHREFWDWVPLPVQEQHIRQAQDILQGYFAVPVVTFVPPGNVFTEGTLEIAGRHGLRYVSCNAAPSTSGPLTVLGNEDVVPFHDRDLVLNGAGWLRALIDRQGSARCGTIAELAGSRG
jgi:peptidoglycan/xylan/chitin deacetylase (PgdA/CDA1 family)